MANRPFSAISGEQTLSTTTGTILQIVAAANQAVTVTSLEIDGGDLAGGTGRPTLIEIFLITSANQGTSSNALVLGKLSNFSETLQSKGYGASFSPEPTYPSGTKIGEYHLSDQIPQVLYGPVIGAGGQGVWDIPGGFALCVRATTYQSSTRVSAVANCVE